jgi:hypothetical protein
MRSHFANQRRQKLAPDIRSYILRDLVAKAAVDDPVHPGWPAGAPDRQGGRFRPKDEVAAAGNPTSSPRPNSRPKFSARDIPANNPKHPVPLLDSHGNAITDAHGNPLLRPADLPPEMYVRAGRASNLGAYMANIELTRPDIAVGLEVLLLLQLSPFGHGGSLDAERVNGQYVDEYNDYANIAIGLYMAAAGVKLEDALAIVNDYAWFKSQSDSPKDDVYTSTPRRDVENIKMGYELYKSGRISP